MNRATSVLFVLPRFVVLFVSVRCLSVWSTDHGIPFCGLQASIICTTAMDRGNYGTSRVVVVYVVSVLSAKYGHSYIVHGTGNLPDRKAPRTKLE